MQQFEFSLQRVLDYRKLVEEWALAAFGEARQRTNDADKARESICLQKKTALRQFPKTVDDRKSLQDYLERLEDRERELQLILESLRVEEEAARMVWIEKKRDCEVLSKLRAKQYENWCIEFNRWEQKQLDDWNSSQRKSAS